MALQDYAAVGDGRSVALIGLDWSIGRWCVPNLNSAPLFDSLLNTEVGGIFTLQPAQSFEAKHVYREDSNVLETTFTTEVGVVRKEGARVCFRLDGTPVPSVQEMGLPEYRNSRPVMVGNAAGTQSQHGVYGDILEAVAQFVASGNVLDQKSAVILASLADECADRWRQPD